MSEQHPFGYTLHEMDVEAFLNIRNWIREAVEAKGAKEVGAGVGMGQADIDIEKTRGRLAKYGHPLHLRWRNEQCRIETLLSNTEHVSDCAVHNAPALPPGPCDCGALVSRQSNPASTDRT